MKKAILSLAITAASLFGANQAVVAQTEVNATSKAVISVDKDVHDYGTIEQGANGECVFTVTNTGTEPLIISLCKGSCGCTVPVCPTEPIAPGASAKITVKYNTAKPMAVVKFAKNKVIPMVLIIRAIAFVLFLCLAYSA